MKKRILLPVLGIGGLLVYLASQLFSFNLGLGVPESRNLVSVESPSPSTQAVDTPTEESLQTVVEATPKLLLVDVVIDGDEFSANRVTTAGDDGPMSQRERQTVEQIVTLVLEAAGDTSGTRVRISRTAEAIASAEAKLLEALQAAGISSDAIDKRSRLVE